MINKFFLVIKRVVMAALLIYAYDSLTVLNTSIPINFFTLSLVSFFGIFAMFGLIFFSFLF